MLATNGVTNAGAGAALRFCIFAAVLTVYDFFVHEATNDGTSSAWCGFQHTLTFSCEQMVSFQRKDRQVKGLQTLQIGKSFPKLISIITSLS